MKLDRNTNPDGSGKYAIVKLRRIKQLRDDKQRCLSLLRELDGLRCLDFGTESDTEFFVIRLKDKYAACALGAYALAALRDDPEYGLEVLNLAKKAAEHINRKMPD